MMKELNFTYRGLVVPVFTPFNNDSDRTLNLSEIPVYAKYLADSGVMGVAVGATSGEGPSMNVSERKLLTEAWIEARKKTKQHIMIQVGGAPLPDVLELARHAEHHGADSILCLPDLFTKPSTTKDLIYYLQAVAEAAPDTPLLYYHHPGWTNVNFHMGRFFKEIDGKVPTFGGIKFSSLDLYEGAAAVGALNSKYGVFLGGDMIMAAACALNFDSAIAITLNIFPHHLPRIVQLVKEGKVNEALTVQKELNAGTDIITRNATWVPAVKAAMHFMTPVKLGPPRKPLKPVEEPFVKEMEKELRDAKYI